MAKIVGFQQVNGTNKQGQPYSGVRMFVTEERRNVQGLAVDDVYVGNQFLPVGVVFNVGDEVSFVYNKFGRVEGVNRLKTAGDF